MITSASLQKGPVEKKLVLCKNPTHLDQKLG